MSNVSIPVSSFNVEVDDNPEIEKVLVEGAVN